MQVEIKIICFDYVCFFFQPSSKLTPKKGKQDSRMIKPPKESPAGPTAVRSSTFALMGYVVFSIQQINKKHWSLNKVDYRKK